MVHVPNFEEIVQSILSEAQEQGSYAEMGTLNGLEALEDLRHEFPQATIVTLSLAEILMAVQEAAGPDQGTQDTDGKKFPVT